jgi:hypothetical protein
VVVVVVVDAVHAEVGVALAMPLERDDYISLIFS